MGKHKRKEEVLSKVATVFHATHSQIAVLTSDQLVFWVDRGFPSVSEGQVVQIYFLSESKQVTGVQEFQLLEEVDDGAEEESS